jgi:transcriptional regulator with XRE-family HTH domain
MDEKAEFSARLVQAMADAGYPARPIVLEREFNLRYWGRPISVQAVCRWLKGEAIPSQDKLQVLADWLKVEPHILRFGGQPTHSIQERKKRWDAAIAGPEREVLEAFLNLPAEEKKIVRAVILMAAAACGEKKNPPET